LPVLFEAKGGLWMNASRRVKTVAQPAREFRPIESSTAGCNRQPGHAQPLRRSRGLMLSLSILSLLCLSLYPMFNASGQDNSLRIVGIQAKLFFEGAGTFSDDVLANSHYALWNTPIGEGSAAAPSHSTLVLVEVEGGAAETTEHGRRISFTASYKYGFVNARGTVENRSVQVKQTATIGFLGKDGKSYIGFWLYDTGCTPVDLTAQIVGQTLAPVVKRTIGFKCGE
jgi:hypothetical protein